MCPFHSQAVCFPLHTPHPMADEVEQTLHITREVSAYTIPPRGPSGHVSGNWLVSSRIFQGRLRVISRGHLCELILEDRDSVSEIG